MDPDAMTTLLANHIYNIEKEEYWKACQLTLKSPYELRANDDSSTNNDDNSNRSYDSPCSGDDWGEPSSEREDEDVDIFYEKYDSDVDHYDQDIEDDTETNRWSDTDSDQYRLINVLENAREENAQTNQMYHDEYPYGHLSE